MVLRYAEVLDMTPEQRDLALDLHAAMDEEFRSLWLAYAEWLADSNGRFEILQFMKPEEMRERQEVTDRFGSSYAELRDRFLEDLQLLLDAEQTMGWKRIETERRRAREISLIRDDHHNALIDIPLALQAIDPGAIDLNTSEGINTIVERYILEIESSLDPARRRLPRIQAIINEYELHRRTSIELRARPGGAEGKEVQDARDAMERLGTALLGEALALDRIYATVWQAHDRAAGEIAALLPEREARRFIEALRPWLAAAPGTDRDPTDPEHFRRRFLNAVRIIDSIGSFQNILDTPLFDAISSTHEYRVDGVKLRAAEPLTTEQRERIDVLIEAYRSEIAEWLAIVNEGRDTAESPPTMTRVISFEGGSITLRRVGVDWSDTNWREAPGTDDQLLARVEIEQRYIDRLREILSHGQRMLIVNR
jgi:hypothetical protein